ncbi:MAG: hypothetical protein Q9207_001325 [Kuettlingeria erythrocarpa]
MPRFHVTYQQLTFAYRANTLASETQVEWLDDKRMNIVCNELAIVSALLHLFISYVDGQKDRLREPYEVLKLSRPIETIVRISKNDGAINEGCAGEEEEEEESEEDDTFEVTNTLLPEIVTQGTISRGWCPVNGIPPLLPKRLLDPLLFDSIGKSTRCHITGGAAAAFLTVQGDNEQDVSDAVGRLDNFAKVFSLVCKPPSYHEFLIQEELLDTLQIRALSDREVDDQRSTTLLDPESLASGISSFGVVLMVKKGKAIINMSRSGVTSEATMRCPNKHQWQGIQILRYGNQVISIGSLETDPRSFQSQTQTFRNLQPLRTHQILANATSSPEFASKFVEEWVQTTADVKFSAFEPGKEAPHENPPAELAVSEATEDHNAKTSPAKKRHGRNRKKANTKGDAEIEDDEDASVHNANELPFVSSEEAPSSQTTSYTHSWLHGVEGLRGEGQLIDFGTNDTKPRSPLVVQSADIPRVPTMVQDLLTSKDSLAARPVAVPAPAIMMPAVRTPVTAPSITSPYMPPQHSSRASNASGPPPRGSTPEWMTQNPTNTAFSTRKKGPLLIDDSPAAPAIPQAVSYVTAAKRGAMQPKAAPRARGRGRLYKGAAPSNDRIQSNSEIQSRQVHRTMNQKMAKPPVRHPNQIEAFEAATIQLLQSANTFRGIIGLEVDIGRILIKAGKGAIGRTLLPKDWASVFDDRTGNSPETVFINRLPASDSDMRYVTSLKQPDGRQIFAQDPFETTFKFRFLCGTKTGEEDIILEANNSGSVRILSSEHVVGAVNWHFPKRQWDARLAVKVVEEVQDYQDALEAIKRSLSIIPSSDGKTARLYGELGSSTLTFKTASIHREMRFNSNTYPDIVLSCTEVQDLGPARERQRYWNPHREVEIARKNGDLWWEIRAGSIEADRKLMLSRDLRLGEEADWKAEDVVSGKVQQLHNLASGIVTQIDDIGASINKNTAQTASVLHPNPAKKGVAEETYSFW